MSDILYQPGTYLICLFGRLCQYRLDDRKPHILTENVFRSYLLNVRRREKEPFPVLLNRCIQSVPSIYEAAVYKPIESTYINTLYPDCGIWKSVVSIR